ncbi:spore coat protein GerQ [Bacillus sp. N9]
MPYGQPFAPMPQQMNVPFPVQQPVTPSGGFNVPGMLPVEESYIENILRLNKGKLVQIHSTYEHNKEWNAKVFNGIIEAAGRDHVILSDPQTGKRFLIPMIYVDFITFDEPIEYEYPFGGGAGPLASYPPR